MVEAHQDLPRKVFTVRHASSYSEAGESRAYEFCTTPLTFLNSPPGAAWTLQRAAPHQAVAALPE